METEDRRFWFRTVAILWVGLGVGPLLLGGFGLACIAYPAFVGGAVALAVLWGPRWRWVGLSVAAILWLVLGVAPIVFYFRVTAQAGDAFFHFFFALPGFVGGALAVAVLWRPRFWFVLSFFLLTMVACHAGASIAADKGLRWAEATAEAHLERLRTDPEWASGQNVEWGDRETVPADTTVRVADNTWGEWYLDILDPEGRCIGYMTMTPYGRDSTVFYVDWRRSSR